MLLIIMLLRQPFLFKSSKNKNVTQKNTLLISALLLWLNKVSVNKVRDMLYQAIFIHSGILYSMSDALNMYVAKHGLEIFPLDHLLKSSSNANAYSDVIAYEIRLYKVKRVK